MYMKSNTKVFAGVSPSIIYMNALMSLVNHGKEVSPRGKTVKELRPVVIEYHNPLNRVTFLKGRMINPFFQLAESLWIIAGRSDVDWLTDYNRNMAQFSDDGKYFNAPYGERLRYWNKNDSEGFIFNPFDQLHDVYNKFMEDPYTRQAVASIYNPIFDHSDKVTLDRPCNLMLVFKLRDGKLDLTVYNRSNDLHWGTFGANLCQFSTILELMASWLEVPVGVYYQVTDSLHIYTEDYGAKETDKVLSAYGLDPNSPEGVTADIYDFYTEGLEPRIHLSPKSTKSFLDWYFSELDPFIRSDETYKSIGELKRVLEMVDHGVGDRYFKLTLHAMMAYQAHKRSKSVNMVVRCLAKMPACSWTISCLRFLYKHYGDKNSFQQVYEDLPQQAKDYIERKGE